MNAVLTRLNDLRQVMRANHIDAVIVPSADPHLSEYLPQHYQARRWISGFTGSVGTAIILAKEAFIWADSRYWLQAEQELQGSTIELKKWQIGLSDYADDLAERLPENATVAIDGMVCSVAEVGRLCQKFATKNIKLITLDLISPIWADRPPLPTAPIYAQDEQFVSQTTSEKLAKIRAKMTACKADHHLISSLDDIAWITNLRGDDVDFNPVFLSHLLISTDKATLFVDNAKLNEKTTALLSQAGIETADYTAIQQVVENLNGTLMFDPNKVAQGVVAELPSSVNTLHQVAPSTLLKAVKNEQEIANIREAMEQDGAALCEFFVDLEQRLARQEVLNEVDIDRLLMEARQKQPHYVSPSFDTICGYQENGAVVHYSASPESAKPLVGNGLLLIDSGAQYQNGTTDITRMFGVGEISDKAKRHVTYVLKAHIALAQAHFPVGLASPKLDILVRNVLWQQGLDYGHGTGHGVGYFLNVHEGPQVIMHLRATTPESEMQQGMITSNEPGLYFTGKYGIRLENLVANVPATKTEFGEFLKFETLTLCPFDTRLILPELLTETEKAWLNNYHQEVRTRLLPRVEGEAKTWLIERTQAV